MAHTFGSTVLARSSAATAPAISRACTTTAGDTVLVLVLDVKGGTTRAGGAPTWNVPGTQANTTQKAVTSPEASIEVWYWVAPFIGAGTIAIPNTGGLTIFSAAYTGRAATDRGSAFDVDAGQNATSANPGTSLDTNVAGDIVFAATAGGWQAFAPTARSGTALYETDDGATGGGAQYRLQPAVALTAMAWTFATSDDWGAVAVAFKETLQPTPAPSGLTLTGSVSALALTLGLAAGSLGLTGQAPQPVVSAGSSPTIGIPVGALLFKGPAKPTQSRAVDAVSLTLTGPAPALGLTAEAFVPLGSLSLTGPGPDSLIGQSIALPVGTLAFKGPARLGSVGIDLPVGTLALTGPAPTRGTLSGGATIPIGVGALTLTGPAPLRVANQVAVAIPVGTLRFFGPAGPGGPWSIPVGTGTLTLTGPAPLRSVSNQDQLRQIPVGALALAGPALDLFPGQFAAIPVGALTFDGQYVAQAFDWGQPAALAFTGYAPLPLVGSSHGIPITTPVALTVTGWAPFPNVEAPIPVAAAVLTLNGPAPQATVSNPSGPTLSANNALLTLAGPVVTVIESLSTYHTPGALLLTGWRPQLSVVDPSILTGMVSIPRRERVAVIRGREHLT